MAKAPFKYANLDLMLPKELPNLKIIDMDTGKEVYDCKEVNCEDGWAVQMILVPVAGTIGRFKQDRKVLHGRFELHWVKDPEARPAAIGQG